VFHFVKPQLPEFELKTSRFEYIGKVGSALEEVSDGRIIVL